MKTNSISHYDADYFQWQDKFGRFGGWANLPKFVSEIQKDDVILDFGCGGGWLLKNLANTQKMGVEINDTARIFANEQNSLHVVKQSIELPDDTFDVIISNNALEHCERPLDEISELYKKLKKGGKIVFIVPCEHWRCKWKPNDINMHIYGWTPLTIGNLFTSAGFLVLYAAPYYHKWPVPYHEHIAKYGRFIFDLIAKIYGYINTSLVQIKIIATKQ